MFAVPLLLSFWICDCNQCKTYPVWNLVCFTVHLRDNPSFTIAIVDNLVIRWSKREGPLTTSRSNFSHFHIFHEILGQVVRFLLRKSWLTIDSFSNPDILPQSKHLIIQGCAHFAEFCANSWCLDCFPHSTAMVAFTLSRWKTKFSEASTPQMPYFLQSKRLIS